MADMTPIMARRADKPAPHFTHTPVSRAFAQLLGTMAVFIEAERDIEDVDVWDPAFRGWLTSAEDALASVTTLLHQIGDAQSQRASDRPLQHMACLYLDLMGSESGEEFCAIRATLPGRAPLLRCCGVDPVARRVRAMLRAAHARLDELATLSAYTDQGLDDDACSFAAPPAVAGAA